MIEFLRADSEIAQAVNRDYVAFKEVEATKFLPKAIVKTMQDEGYPRFNMHHHTQLWKSLDAKAPGKGLGVSIAGAWYWYQLDRDRPHTLRRERHPLSLRCTSREILGFLQRS